MVVCSLPTWIHLLTGSSVSGSSTEKIYFPEPDFREITQHSIENKDLIKTQSNKLSRTFLKKSLHDRSKICEVQRTEAMFIQSSASLMAALKLLSVRVLEPVPETSCVAAAPSRPPEAGAQLALGGTYVSALKCSLREVRGH